MEVIKIGAEWCSGCIIMKPRWAEIEKENKWLKTQYYDYDKDKSIIEKYNIDEEIPVFIFLNKEKQEISRLTGETSKEKLLSIIHQYKNN